MKFTEEQINKGIVVSFLGQQAIAHTADEAVSIINSFASAHRNIKGIELLVCNDHAVRYLTSLFNGEEVAMELKTTNCGKYGVCFYEALADTIEEHQRIYNERREAEKRERIREAEELHKKMLADFNMQRKGWYYVKVELTALNLQTDRRKHLENSGYGIAESKMDAYNKFVAGLNDECIKKGLCYEMCSEWNSMGTEVQFVGMRTDYGFSVEAWEEYEKSKK